MSDKLEEVRGRQAIIRFDGGKCIHSRHCVLEQPGVFVANVQGAWIHPDQASPEAIAAVAGNCPSGAIAYERLDGGADEAPPPVNTVRVLENGPLAFRAPLAIGGAACGFRATLCRCGASRNKPYCDRSHVAAGFAATGEPPSKESPPLAVRDGALRVTPLADGPLLVEGALEVISGTGRTVSRTAKTHLCRCGASANKPFCDGSHARVGFKSG